MKLTKKELTRLIALLDKTSWTPEQAGSLMAFILQHVEEPWLDSEIKWH